MSKPYTPAPRTRTLSKSAFYNDLGVKTKVSLVASNFADEEVFSVYITRGEGDAQTLACEHSTEIESDAQSRYIATVMELVEDDEGL